MVSGPLSPGSEEGQESELEGEDLASDDSGMETILEGDEEEGVEAEQKQGVLFVHRMT